MLSVFILLGLATAAAVPFLMAGEGADAGEDEGVPVPEPPEEERGRVDAERASPPQRDASDPRDVKAGVPPPAPDEAAAPKDPDQDADAPQPRIETVTIALADDPAAPDGVLLPEPGDAPDIPAGDPFAGVPLSPAAGDTPDAPGQGALLGTPLLPEDGDAPEAAPAGAMPDPAIGAQDAGPQDAGPEDPAAPAAFAGPADIAGFTPGQDSLELTLVTDRPADEIDLGVTPSGDGQDAVVTADGHVVALLRGAPAATPEDIVLAVQPPADAPVQTVGTAE